jgi:hypothetical protein
VDVIPKGPLAVIANPVINVVLNPVAYPTDVADPVLDVVNEIFLTSILFKLEVIYTVVAKPTFKVADSVRLCTVPSEFPPAPTIESGETVKLVILQLSFKRVSAEDVLNPLGAPCTVTAKPWLYCLVVEIPKEVVNDPAETVDRDGNTKLLIVKLVTIFLIVTFDKGAEFIVNVIVAVCNPNTGFV